MNVSADIAPSVPNAAAPPEQKKGGHKVHKTTGEKWFDALRFLSGEVFILGLTAALAYASKYGKESYLGVPNVFKHSEKWLSEKLAPADKSNEFKVRLGGAVASTTALMHGGNLYIPVRKQEQEHKPEIVAHFNKRFGKPGEVEEGNLRLKHQTPESWGDIIKGRLISWGVIFTAFVGADMIAGKKTLPDGRQEYWFDLFKDKAGRMVAGLTKEGKEIAKTPLTERLTEVQFKNKAYRFGKILALDVFATTAALAVWNSVSKFSAIMRGRKGAVAVEAGQDEALAHTTSINHPAAAQDAPAETPEQKRHAVRVGDPATDYRTRAEKSSVSSGASLS